MLSDGGLTRTSPRRCVRNTPSVFNRYAGNAGQTQEIFRRDTITRP